MKAAWQRNPILPFLLILLMAIAAYWQIALLRDLLKWDNIDAYHPYRYFVVECIRNGEFPWWNPYQFLGYPIYSDPQSGAWYPLLWIFAMISPYSFSMMNLEFTLHIVIAGWGMYIFNRELGRTMGAAIMASITYMFCGFIVETAQLLPFVISLAWLPWVLYCFFKLLKNEGFLWPVGFGICLGLMLTGGYPAFVIILFYILFTITVGRLFKTYRNRNYQQLKTLVYRLIASVAVLMMIAGGYLKALYQSLPYFSRSSGMEYNEAFYSYAVTLDSLKGFLAPISGMAEKAADSDLFTYGYFGIFSLLLFLVFPAIKPGRMQWSIFGLSLFFFMAAMGDLLPVRYWLFKFVPGMSLFRHPIIFLAFAQIGWAVNGAFALDQLIRNYPENRMRWKVAIGILSLTAIGFLICWPGLFSQKSFSDAIKVVVFADVDHHWISKIALQTIVVATGLLLLNFVLWLSSGKKRFTAAIVLVVFADLFMAVQLNRSRKITGDIRREIADIELCKMPSGFPIPDLDIAVSEMNDHQLNFPIPGNWKNLNIYSKRVAYDGYSPFILNSYDDFRKKPGFPNQLNAPFLAFYNDRLGDYDPSVACSIRSYSPTDITIEVQAQRTGYLGLLQSYFPGWKVAVDEQAVNLLPLMEVAMAVELNPGSHVVRFYFEDKWSNAMITFSLITLFVLIIWMMHRMLPPQSWLKKIAYLLILFLVARFAMREVLQYDSQVHLKSMKEELAEWSEIDQSAVCFNVDSKKVLSPLNSTTIHFLRFKESSLYNHQNLQQLVNKAKTPYFVYGYQNVFNPPEVEHIIRSKFPVILKQVKVGKGSLVLYGKGKSSREDHHDKIWTVDFESDVLDWKYDLGKSDTSMAYSGVRSMRLDTVFAFGPIFSMKYQGELLEYDHAIISAQINPANKYPEGSYVFAVENAHGKYIWKSQSLTESLETAGKWTSVYWSVNLKPILEEGDVFKAYVWNLGKSTLNLDDFNIKLIKSEEYD